MALAGPATNLLLALVPAFLIRVGYEWQFFRAPFSIAASHLTVAVNDGPAEIAAPFLSIMLSLNLLLCLLNLVPLPPPDGSSAPCSCCHQSQPKNILKPCAVPDCVSPAFFSPRN